MSYVELRAFIAGVRHFLILFTLAFAFGACSSGGPASQPMGPVAPPPPPPPPDSSAEFNANRGLGKIHADIAYTAGFTGAGVLVAVIDNGFDRNHVDLKNKLHPASQDVVPGQTSLIENSNGVSHGTGTASVVAGEKNGLGSHGVAYDATILALAVESDALLASGCQEIRCTIADDDIATAINIAVDNGAKVISMSLGGPTPNANLAAALKRAADAGIVIVIAAGNSSFPDPSDFALFGLDPSVLGSVIIAGGSNTAYDDLFFTGAPRPDGGVGGSNQAGIAQDIYVVGPGQNILVAVSRNFAGNSQSFANGTGTSFATPHIAGTAALLIQAFPNLTAQEVVQIILTTADDAGAPGVDARFGHGFLNLTAAFQPLGPTAFTTSADGTISDADPLVDDTGFGFGFAFGDAFKKIDALKSVMITDSYQRSFMVDATTLFTPLFEAGADVEPFLHSNAASGNYLMPFGTDTTLFFGVRTYSPDRDPTFFSRYLGSEVPFSSFSATQNNEISELGFMKFDTKVGKKTSFTFATGLAPDAVLASTNKEITASFDFVTTRQAGHSYFSQMQGLTATGIGWNLSPKTRLGFVASYGKYKPALGAFQTLSPTLEGKAFSAVIGLNQTFKDFSVNAAFGSLSEQNAILGSLTSGALDGGNRAQTWFANIGAAANLGNGFMLSGNYQKGITSIRGAEGLITGFSSIATSSFSAMLTKANLIKSRDRFGLYVGQPIHVDSGSVSLRLPTGRDYVMNRILFTEAQAGVAPSGRQVDYEIFYSLPLGLGFDVDMNLFYQKDAGHQRGLNNAGAAIRLKRNLF